MAELGYGFVIKTAEMRPCFVGDKKALFHRWSEQAEIVPPSILKGGHGGGVVRGTLAVVEYEDGTVGLANLEKIRFFPADNFREYDWERAREAAKNEK